MSNRTNKIISAALSILMVNTLAFGVSAQEVKCGNGDLDENSVVELTDLTILSQHLLGDRLLDSRGLYRSDVTGDGNTDIADLAHLRQYINKENVILGKQPASDETPTAQLTDLNLFASHGLGFDAQSDYAKNNLNYIYDENNNETANYRVMKTSEDIKEYIDSSDEGPVPAEVSDKFVSYNVDFFENNVLIALQFSVNAGSFYVDAKAEINDSSISVTGMPYAEYKNPVTSLSKYLLLIPVTAENYKDQSITFNIKHDCIIKNQEYKFGDIKLRSYDDTLQDTLGSELTQAGYMQGGKTADTDYVSYAVIESVEELKKCFSTLVYSSQQFVSVEYPDKIQEYNSDEFYENKVLIAVQTNGFPDILGFQYSGVDVDENTITVHSYLRLVKDIDLGNMHNSVAILEIPRSEYNHQKIVFDVSEDYGH
ncbi:MAG: dockerin type I repeat-containing protein [Oscillospiraceae bacterium]|nr:dockerin type I repeat-containing protein [Oscillospiraceae bacterium]